MGTRTVLFVAFFSVLTAEPSVALQSTPTIGLAQARLRVLQTQTIQHGEFETTSEFARRQATFTQSHQKSIDSLVRRTYRGSGTVTVGPYNADSEYYPVTIHASGFTEEVILRLPRAQARSVRSLLPKATVTGTFWLEGDGSTHLAGAAALHVGGRTYPTEPSKTRIRFMRERTLEVSEGGFALSPDGKLLAVPRFDDNERLGIQLLRFPDLRPLVTISPDQEELPPAGLAFSPDSRLLIAGRGVWDVATGLRRTTLVVPSPYPSTNLEEPRFSPDGSMLATENFYGNPRNIVIWQPADGKLLRAIEYPGGHLAELTFSSDGLWLIGVSSKDAAATITLWNASTGEMRGALDIPGYLDLASFSSDRMSLALLLCDASRTQCTIRVQDAGLTEDQRIIRCTWCRSSGIGAEVSLRPSANGRMVAIGGVGSSDLRNTWLWDTVTGAELRSWREGGFEHGDFQDLQASQVEFSPDGNWLILKSEPHYGTGGRLRVREIQRIP